MPNKDPQGPSGAICALKCVLALLVVATLAFAFTLPDSPHDEPDGRAALDTPAVREALALERELLTIEAKMHLSLSWSLHQTELARRHAHVSAIACSSAADHAKDTLRLAERALRRSIRQAARANAKPTHPASKSADAPEPKQAADENGQRSG